jgi:hypothetical protein
MAPFRSLLHAHRALAALLLALALLMKVVVPAGVMIDSDTRTLSIAICDGQAHHPLDQVVVKQTGKPAGGHGNDARGDGTCPYAALGHAGLAGADPVLLALALAFILALGFAPVRIVPLAHGRHLRPPLRGPPARA